jgi:hypothetical protein
MREFDEDEGWRGSDRNRDDRNRDEHHQGFMLGDRRGRTDRERAPRIFSSRQDDHYLSWRDKQMDALDRDYADYCREREQQFHRDFDAWRINRRDTFQQTGMPTDQRSVSSSEPVMDLTEPAVGGAGPNPVDEATIGSNAGDTSGTGRGRR